MRSLDEEGRGHGPLLSRRGRQRLRLPPPLPARERKNARARVCHPLSRRLWQRAGLSLRLSQVQRKRARHYPPLFIGRQRTKLLSRKEWQTTRLPPLPSDKERLSASARAIPLRKMKAECRTLSSSLPRKREEDCKTLVPSLLERKAEDTIPLSPDEEGTRHCSLVLSRKGRQRARLSHPLSPRETEEGKTPSPPLKRKAEGRTEANFRQAQGKLKSLLRHAQGKPKASLRQAKAREG